MGKVIWEEDTFSEMKEKVIEENRGYWANKNNVTQGDKWIYVYHGMSQVHFNWAIHEDIVAKGLQAKTGLPIMSVIDGLGQALPEGLDSSFGILESTHLLYSQYVNKRSEEIIYSTADKMAKATYKDKDKLLQLEYRGIEFGDELYDHLLKKNWQDDVVSFDCFDISIERYAHYIRAALSLIDQAFNLFSQKCPAYVITTEKLLLKRLFGNVARTFGAKEIIILPDWPEALVEIPAEISNRKISISEIMDVAIKSHMKTVDAGFETTDNLFVVPGEHTADSYDFRKKLGISNDHKNVFIFPHAFIDAPREGCRLNFYRDYLEWFVETIRIIQDIRDVNWIIKDHPMTAYYKQSEYVRKIFLENRTPNMYWCDSDVSGMYIKDFADGLVTCGGEAALEYWAYGIPTVTTAKTGFMAHGISYNMKSLEDYEHILRNISDLKRPSEESSKKAQTMLLAMKRMSSCVAQDQLVNLFINTRRKQADSYRSGLSFRHIYTFCEGYLALLEQGNLEESCIYQMKNLSEIAP